MTMKDAAVSSSRPGSVSAESSGLSRRRFLAVALAGGLTAATVASGNGFPLPALAEGAEKGEKKKRHEKEADDTDEKEEEKKGQKAEKTRKAKKEREEAEDKEEKEKDEETKGKRQSGKTEAESKSEKKGKAATSQAPTDKEECKKGGWRKFTNPAFKNQGQCVSYMEHQKQK